VKSTSHRLLESLKENGADFFVSVPCKWLSELIVLLEQDTDVTYLAVTREEEGVGICAGAYLAGKTPVMVIQNSGIGNSANALCSLALYYQIPLLMITTHRGTHGETVGAQVPFGIAVTPILDTIGVPSFAFSQGADVEAIGKLVGYARTAQRPVAALLDYQFWQNGT